MKCFLEGFNVITGIATLVSLALAIVSFVFYIRERHKRKNDSSSTVAFLHGIKPTIQGMAQNGNVSTNVWSSLLEQINDMMARLIPPKPKKGKREK